MSCCALHQGGRWKPQHGPCIDCRRAEIKTLELMLRSERNRILDGSASPAYRTWQPYGEVPESPDRMHPERKQVQYGKEENRAQREA